MQNMYFMCKVKSHLGEKVTKILKRDNKAIKTHTYYKEKKKKKEQRSLYVIPSQN